MEFKVDIKTPEFLEKLDLKAALKEAEGKAAKMMAKDGAIDKFLVDLEEKLQDNPGFNFATDVVQLASLIRSYVAKEYTEVSSVAVVTILGALIYFVSPLDLIPDWIVGLGLLDDAGLIALCISSVKSEVDKYVLWRDSQSDSAEIVASGFEFEIVD